MIQESEVLERLHTQIVAPDELLLPMKIEKSLTADKKSSVAAELFKGLSAETQTEQSRVSLNGYLNKEGIILSDNHEFTQVCRRVCDRLGVPPEVEIIMVDTENYGLAFYSSDAKAVVIGKGVFTYLQKNGLKVAEDDIAFILAHELTHAKRGIKEAEEHIKSKQTQGLSYAFAGHNQEHEADRKGMLWLAEAGYNPTAALRVIEHFANLKRGRSSGSHPQDLMRYQHLQDILYGDKQPMANTGKPFTEIADELQQWLVSPSEEVYQLTEQAVTLPAAELHDRLLKTTNPEEYFLLLRAYKEAARVERAKAVVELPLFKELERKALIIQLFSQEQIYYNGHIYNTPFNSNDREQYRYSFEAHSTLEFLPTESYQEKTQPEPNFLTAAAYRSGHSSDESWLRENRQSIEEQMKLEIEKLDQTIELFLSSYFFSEEADMQKLIRYYGPHAETLQHFLHHLKDIYEGSAPVDHNILASLFMHRTKAGVEQEVKQMKERRPVTDVPVVRSEIDALYKNVIDFEGHLEQVHEGFSVSMAKRMTASEFMPADIRNHFAKLIEADLPMVGEKAVQIADLFLYGGKLQNLSWLSDDELMQVGRYYDRLCEIGTGRLSPQREAHISYVRSIADKKAELSSGEFVATLHWDLSDEILSRRYKGPGKYRRNQEQNRWSDDGEEAQGETHIPTIDEFDMTFEDWKVVFTLDDYYRSFYQSAALREYLNAAKKETTPLPEAVDVIKEFEAWYADKSRVHFPDNIKLSLDDLIILQKQAPWDPPELTLRLLSDPTAWLVNEDTSQLDLTDLQKMIDFYTAFLQQTESFPLEKRSGEYDAYPSNVTHIRKKVILKMYESHMSAHTYLHKNSPDEGKKEEIIRRTLKSSIQAGLLRVVADIDYLKWQQSYSMYSSGGEYVYNRNDINAYLLTAEESGLLALADSLKEHEKTNSEDFSIAESLRLLSVLDPINATDLELADSQDERFVAFAGLARGEPHHALIDKLITVHGDQLFGWIQANFHQSHARNRLCAAIMLCADEPLRKVLAQQWAIVMSGADPDHLTERLHPENTYARKTAVFDEDADSKYHQPSFYAEELYATTEEEYRNIATRRHPFRTISISPTETASIFGSSRLDNLFPSDKDYSFSGSGDYSIRGNYEQKVIAQLLYEVQDQLVDGAIPFEQRMAQFDKCCPCKSVAADVHLERMMRTELQQSASPEVVQHCEALLSRFARHDFTDSYAGRLIEMKLQLSPESIKNFDLMVDQLILFLPKASLKRNHYLSQIEQNCSITPEQAKRLQSLRLTEELETEEGDQFYMMSIVNQLSSETSRKEKREVALWLLQLASKPQSAQDLEYKWNGKLDSVPSLFMDLVPEEREMILKKMLLGNEGVIDLTGLEGDDKYEAMVQRDYFIYKLGEKLIPDDMPNSKLFRRLFTTVLIEATPVKSAQITTQLINQMIEAGKRGEEFTPSEALSTALCSLGVVGKKVAQSLAEMEWVPTEFRSALLKSQENADQIPKSALVEMARQNGLLAEGGPVQILSFDELLGAASNKQACRLTVRINDQTIVDSLNQHLKKRKKASIKIGDTVRIVGKFKRPSAQRENVLKEDLSLLKKAVGVIEEEVGETKIPNQFENQIKSAVTRELDFKAEENFNTDMAAELDTLNPYKGFEIFIPTILTAHSDFVLETEAEGVSLRSLIDKPNKTAEEERALQVAMEANVLILLTQLLVTGNIDADFHPGNEKIQVAEKIIEPIDLGMHVRMDKNQVSAVRSLIMAIAKGESSDAGSALAELGWNIDVDSLHFVKADYKKRIAHSIARTAQRLAIPAESPIHSLTERQRPQALSDVFSDNIQSLLEASRSSRDPIPEDIAMMVFAVSKLQPYLAAIGADNFAGIMAKASMFAVKHRLKKGT